MRRTELGAIEERSNRLKHALQVLGQLNALLDMANGGVCAENLARFYEFLRRRILLAQFRRDPSILESAVRNIFQVRAALQQVDSRNTQPEGNPASPANGRPGTPAPDAEAGPNAQSGRLPFSCSA
jgi:flagellin-specific chaperone FliS